MTAKYQNISEAARFYEADVRSKYTERVVVYSVVTERRSVTFFSGLRPLFILLRRGIKGTSFPLMRSGPRPRNGLIASECGSPMFACTKLWAFVGFAKGFGLYCSFAEVY